MRRYIMFETECALCKCWLGLKYQITADVPDFCVSCYMAIIHPKVELHMQSILAGQMMPDIVGIAKRVMAQRLPRCK